MESFPARDIGFVQATKRAKSTVLFPRRVEDGGAGGIAHPDAFRKEIAVDWTFFSPAAVLFEGPRLGHYRAGGNQIENRR